MENRNHTKTPGIILIICGIGWFIPLFFYFILLPAAGSSAVHAQYPLQFLPWMIESGAVREGLWYTSGFAFMLNFLFVPYIMFKISGSSVDYFSIAGFLAGICGFLVIVISIFMLAGGEMPLALSYTATNDPAVQEAVVAIYNYQRIMTAVLFDFLGFVCLGIWILFCSICGLKNNRPKFLQWLGLITAAACFCFAFGYILQISWLGEMGIGLLSFLFIPVWTIGNGVMLITGKTGR